MTVSSQPVSASRTTARIDWIDASRGAAMVLLLIWHAASIPEVLGIPMPHWVEVSNDALHLVRMPLLMFLSGYVAHRALSRPPATYYRRKVATLVWPYAIWALLDLTTFEHQTTTDLASWNGTGYLWFLYFVIAYSMVAPLLKRVPPLLVSALAAVGASVLHWGFPDDDMLLYASFFFAGLAAAKHPELFARLLRSWPLVTIGGIAGAAMCIGWAMGHHPNEGHVAPFALGGVVAVIAVVSRIRRFPARVTAIGRRSIVWYVVHLPLMHLTVVALKATGVDVPWVVFFATALAAAFLVCPVVVRLADHVPTKWLFSAPPPLGTR